MAAVFGIGLSEHHQFDIGGITLGFSESFSEVIDFIFTHCQTHREVGISQSLAAFFEQVHCYHGFAGQFRKECFGFNLCVNNAFCHAVMKNARYLSKNRLFGDIAAKINTIECSAFNTNDDVKAAVVSNIGCFTGPGADSAQSRNNHEGRIRLNIFSFKAIMQKRLQTGAFIFCERSLGMHEMHETGRNSLRLRRNLTNLL